MSSVRRTPYPFGELPGRRPLPRRDPDRMASYRGAWTALIESLLATGEPERARELCEVAVRHGVWRDPWQRPALHFVPDAPAVSIHDADAFWFTELLQESYPRIRVEVDRVERLERTGAMPVEQSILAYGRWEQVVFYDNGVRFDGPPQLFPETAAALDRIHARERLPGLASLLWLHPGSRVAPHCGHTNSRLRVHLGVRVPEGAGMRVREEVVTWEEGRVLVFDDSYEHEVWNQGGGARVILLLDVLNPAVPPAELAPDDRRETSFEDAVQNFMREHHLRRVARSDDAEGLRPVFDEVMARTVRRYFRHGNIESVELQGGRLIIKKRATASPAEGSPAARA